MQLLVHISRPVQYIQPLFDSMATVIQAQHRDTLCCMTLPLSDGMGSQKAVLWYAAALSFAALFSPAGNQSCGNCVSQDRRWPVQQVSVLGPLLRPSVGEIVHPCSSNLNHQPATPTPFASLVQLVDAEGNVREDRGQASRNCATVRTSVFDSL